MFSRSIISELETWKRKENRKPLIIRGARQVGKTTAIELFAKSYPHFIKLDLERKEDAGLFRDELAFEDILQAILLAKKKRRIPGETLLFIDEIQNSGRAMAMMRFLFESARDIHVIAAGSLLETMIGKWQISFPVGRIEYLFMYPLTFEEYLIASGEDRLLEAYHSIPFPAFAYGPAFTCFHRYCLIGGMPEIVQHYLESRDIVALSSIYQGLMTSYRDDVSKYARNDSMGAIFRHAIDSAPFEAGKRIKFQGFGNSHYRSREMGEALRTLQRAMLVYLIYPTTAISLPIMADRKKSPRLQFLDTGLINYLVGLQDSYFRMNDLHSFYKGIMAEHVVGQELLAHDAMKPGNVCFWVREKKQSAAEVDFVIGCEGRIVPVEVKSGKSGTLRSIHQFVSRSQSPYAVRLYAGPLEKHEAVTTGRERYTLLNLPYFLAGKLHDYADWLLGES